MAGTTSKSISQPLTDLRIKGRCVLFVNQGETAVRRQDRGKGD